MVNGKLCGTRFFRRVTVLTQIFCSLTYQSPALVTALPTRPVERVSGNLRVAPAMLRMFITLCCKSLQGGPFIAIVGRGVSAPTAGPGAIPGGTRGLPLPLPQNDSPTRTSPG
jgi:hypothetical protein